MMDRRVRIHHLYKVNFPKLFLILLLSALSRPVFAEYQKLPAEFLIETREGRIIHGYVILSNLPVSMDSLNSENRLLKDMSNGWLDSVTYYTDRLAYYYVEEGDGELRHEYLLLGKQRFPLNRIRHIKLIAWERGSYLNGIRSDLKKQDEVWMREKPLRSVHYYGAYCDFLIFIHKESPKTDQLLAELKVLTDAAAVSGDPGDYEAVLKKFNGQKVVIITTCTC